MAGYRELEVWKIGMQLTSAIYRLTGSFPKHEQFGLTSQLRRAAVSIPSNIAEGHARGSSNELRRFCTIARGSLAEVETQLLIAEDLGLLNASETEQVHEMANRLGKMLSGLIRSCDR
ncbi:MAG: four helix bundle protein [Lacipirellulaceae bacterium]